MAEFQVTSTDGPARAGIFRGPHGEVETPAFMPVATQGAVKAVTSEEVEEAGYRLIMANLYHMALRPGVDALVRLGGLHEFMGWPHLIATDSGGFQVYSLAKLREVSDRGVVFHSHIDGALLEFTPEGVVRMQESLGSDLAMCLDECPPFGCPLEESERAVTRTLEWAKRSRGVKRESGGALFGIIQGGIHLPLRERSARETVALGFDGYALGGLSVGEPKSATFETLEFTAPFLPTSSPRYLMGVGEPGDILDAVGKGVDLFDCVFPTRVARNGLGLARSGRVVVRNSPASNERGPVDPTCKCPVCARYSQAYIRHLIHAKEITGMRLLTLHNLYFMRELLGEARAAIVGGHYAEYHREQMAAWRAPENGARGSEEC